MRQPMHILILDDNRADAELMKRELRKAGFDFTDYWAQDKATFMAALESPAPDLILADYSLPGFDGWTGLKLARQHWANVPVVIVSGAIGEEAAIEALKAGATDYVLKQRLSRLGPVVLRALAEVRERVEKGRAEEALRQSEERFRLLIEGVQDYAILTLDSQGRITSWNAAASRLYGWSAQEALGQHCSLFSTPADRESGLPQRALEQAVTQGRFEEEGERVRKDGRCFWADVVLTSLRDQKGQLTGFAKITRDVTERKQAEASLRELNATLESKVVQRTAQLQQRARQLQRLAQELCETEARERRQLGQILHDDLQQGLSAARFHLTMLSRGVRSDASLQTVASEVDQMLCDAMEKARSLSHELSPVVLSLGDLGEVLKWLSTDVATKHGLAVQMDAISAVGPVSPGITTFLFRAAQEMLFNVVKHARVKAARLRVRRHGTRVHLSVSDRGCGFDPERLRQTLGFGVLSIRERTSLLGGSMRVRSAIGKGSVFHIAVPDGRDTGDRQQNDNAGKVFRAEGVGTSQ